MNVREGRGLRIRLLSLSFFRTRKAGLKSLRNLLFCLTPGRTHPMAQAYSRGLLVPKGLGGAGSREPWHFSPSPSGESLEPASASLTAHGQTDVPPIPFPPREPLGQAWLPQGSQESSCHSAFAFTGEDTSHLETETTVPQTQTGEWWSSPLCCHMLLLPQFLGHWAWNKRDMLDSFGFMVFSLHFYTDIHLLCFMVCLFRWGGVRESVSPHYLTIWVSTTVPWSSFAFSAQSRWIRLCLMEADHSVGFKHFKNMAVGHWQTEWEPWGQGTRVPAEGRRGWVRRRDVTEPEAFRSIRATKL